MSGDHGIWSLIWSQTLPCILYPAMAVLVGLYCYSLAVLAYIAVECIKQMAFAQDKDNEDEQEWFHVEDEENWDEGEDEGDEEEWDDKEWDDEDEEVKSEICEKYEKCVCNEPMKKLNDSNMRLPELRGVFDPAAYSNYHKPCDTRYPKFITIDTNDEETSDSEPVDTPSTSTDSFDHVGNDEADGEHHSDMKAQNEILVNRVKDLEAEVRMFKKRLEDGVGRRREEEDDA
ncbi:hypothetical protein B0T21DRAFT_116020 [Apiosordaria backusii]|uniref:Uncharacterized protein n=1 Tax=Apiosordaria backusii TaxID=314023 RepID=A0AA40DIN8_9PEZI|nr:hypothetical protein B0T21DRAFT_116020 [Apiosordaria backusii]